MPDQVAIEDAGAGVEITTPVEWRLPHSGPPSGPDCGVYQWYGHYSAQGGGLHAWRRRHDCGQRYCGVCKSEPHEGRCIHCGQRGGQEGVEDEVCLKASSGGYSRTHEYTEGGWLVRGWERREARIIAARWARYLKGPLGGRVVTHVVLSPPQDQALVDERTAEGYKLLRQEACDIARLVGVGTATVVYHSVRMGEDAGAAWGCRPGPHFHLICTAAAHGRDGWVDGELVAWVYERDGWVVKNVGPRYSIYATAAYLLSHAALSCLSGDPSPWTRAPPLQTVTWFGYQMDWPPPEDPGEAAEWCPVCKAELNPVEVRRVIWLKGEGPAPPPDGVGLIEPSEPGCWYTFQMSLSEEWAAWRRARDIFEITAGAEGTRHPGPPPGYED